MHTDSDSSKQIEDLNRSIEMYKKQLEEANAQKNQWREKSCSYSQVVSSCHFSSGKKSSLHWCNKLHGCLLSNQIFVWADMRSTAG